MKISDSTAILVALSTSGILAAHPANAYELSTHARITYKSYENSALRKDQTLPKDLGIDSLITSNPDNPFGTSYYDLGGSTIAVRTKTSFEKAIMDDSDNPNPVIPSSATDLSLPGWLMRGAIREDDLGNVLGYPRGDNPHDDPYGDIFRVFNHFFDPYYDQALSYVPGAKKNPDWAIGSSNVFSDPNTPETGRRNHFTVFDAREAMYRALAGKKLDGTNATPNASDNNPAPEQVRKTYWATTFRALGDILHLNQDMAQPQHTRNEPHSGKGGWLVDELLTGHESVLEKYLEARVTGDSDYKLDGAPIIPAPLVHDTNPPYPVPSFNTISKSRSNSPS